MENLMNKKLELLDAMLDDRIEMYGVINTIQYLLDNDFTKEELLEMKFDEADINKAVEEDIEDLEDDYEDVLADLNEYMAQNISACFRKKFGYDITLYDLVIFLRNKNKVNLPIYIIPYTREKGKAK